MSHILCLDKGAGPPVPEVGDVQPAARPCRKPFERVVDVAGRDAHPRRAAEPVTTLRIGLRRELGHAVFRMDFLHPEGVAEYLVELLFRNLLAVTLHAAGLHHHRIPEFRGIALRKVPQRVAHAQQDFRLFIPRHRLQQRLVVVEVEAARAAVGQKPVGHVDQRRTLAPQVVGQQGVEAPMFGGAVKSAERSAECLFVERQRLHRVTRGRHARRRRRGEDRLGGRFTAVDVVGFEQFDGQERNLFR